jgi:glucosylceramidase
MKKIPLYLGFLWLLNTLAACQAAPSREALWICTTAAEPWKTQPAPHAAKNLSSAPDIMIQTKKPLQAIDGFGGCFNELGWNVLLALPEADRAKVMHELFADQGCGFTLARLPIGASDYGREWYSLDDTPDDLALTHFSIDRDRGYLLKYVKAATDVRPDLGIWISAWSPPAWMKDNNKYNGGHLKADPAVRAAYAFYLAKSVQAYQGEGLHVYAIMVQNEPKSNSSYPTCVWDGPQMRDFVRDYMGPAFRDQKVSAELWLGTLNDAKVADYAIPVLSDPAAAAFITGVAYQWEGKDAIAETHRRWPELKLMQSESECGKGANSFSDAEYTFSLIRKYLNAGASSYFYWNMVLQPGGKSKWGWVQNALITIDPATQAVTYHPEFFLMKHVAHFVRPGSHLATCTGAWGDKLAFVGADGSAVLLVGNSRNEPLPVTIGTDRSASLIQVTLPAHSLSTMVIPASF